jgi:hypothetical protein
MNRTAHLSGSRSEGGLSRSACQQPRGSANLQVVAVPRHRLPELMVMIWVAGRRLCRWKVGVLPDSGAARHACADGHIAATISFGACCNDVPTISQPSLVMAKTRTSRRRGGHDRARGRRFYSAGPSTACRAGACGTVGTSTSACARDDSGPPHVGDDRRIVVVRLVSPQSPVPRTVL